MKPELRHATIQLLAAAIDYTNTTGHYAEIGHGESTIIVDFMANTEAAKAAEETLSTITEGLTIIGEASRTLLKAFLVGFLMMELQTDLSDDKEVTPS